jgi:hypothetical protein
VHTDVTDVMAGFAPLDSCQRLGHGRASVYDILTSHDPGIQ